jgi:hypothetical protein
MINIKTFEEFTKVEYVAPEKPHHSYKNTIKKRKKKEKGEPNGEPVMVPPNHTKDMISFTRTD